MSEGAAFCRVCGALNRLRDILDDGPLAETDLDQTPSGCSLTDDGLHAAVRASMRSGGGAASIFLFAAFWNSLVSIFVLIAIGETINLLTGSLPSWFPAPVQGFGGGVGTVIFLWIFLTPFIAIGLGLLLAFLTMIAGRVEVRWRDAEGVAFIGIGSIGWKRRFDASAVKSVRLGETTWKQNEQTKPVIVIEADRTIRIGSMLPDERRNWMAAALRRLLAQ